MLSGYIALPPPPAYFEGEVNASDYQGPGFEVAGNRTTASAPPSYYDVKHSTASASPHPYNDMNGPVEGFRRYDMKEKETWQVPLTHLALADLGSNDNPNVNIGNIFIDIDGTSRDKQVECPNVNIGNVFIDMDGAWQDKQAAQEKPVERPNANIGNVFIDMDGAWQDKQVERLWNGPGLIEGCHIKSWTFTIGTVSLLVLLVLMNVGILDIDNTDFEGFVIIFALVLFMFFYLIETCLSNSFRYLRQIHEKGAVESLVNNIKDLRPSVKWHVQCYHYEDRTIGESEERVRVNTWSTTGYFKFDSWFDASAPLQGMDQFRLTRLKLKTKFVFDNEFTFAEFRRQKNSFKALNMRDTHQDYKETLIVPGFKSNILSEAEKDARPCCLNLVFYLFFHLVCLGPCYRTWFSSICGKITHDIVKVMSCD
jgi:hypothetical protein